MIDLSKKHVPCKWLVCIRPSFLTLAPDDPKIQEMCNEAVHIDPWLLYHGPDYLKTQEMCNEAIKRARWLLNLRMSIRAIHPLRFIAPNRPKTQGVYERAVEKDPWQLKFFLIISRRRRCVTRQCADDGYKKGKTKKSQLKKGSHPLLGIH